MEKKIQELKDKLLNDLEMFMHNSIEQFTSLLSDISNEYLVKTKERELELKEEIGSLSEQRDDLIIYINGAKESAKDFTEKMKKLDERGNKIKLGEKELSGTMQSVGEHASIIKERETIVTGKQIGRASCRERVYDLV